ncbi:hypothetical protein M0811_05459 [Anaeramoeba ignava]|uniref:GTP-binding protein n=1 Tax=Anaeramoeba ignava TaxID=1746090 RepID=A0A9Q0RF49_ANAIG|nr:hypothetical protein M0811_05459 [Anaeramoeba ignava]
MKNKKQNFIFILFEGISPEKSSNLEDGLPLKLSRYSFLLQIHYMTLPFLILILGCVQNLNYRDTSGEERYFSVSKSYYRDAVGAFIIYDITNEESFNKLDFWFEEFINFSKENAIPMIIGNKFDLEKERKISKEMGENFAEENKGLFMETSAKDGTNIQEAFEELTKEILNVFENEQKKDNITINNPDSQNDSSCFILIGNRAAGKTNIISRFQKNEFNPNSKTIIGAEFANIILEIKGKKIQLQTWDFMYCIDFLLESKSVIRTHFFSD